MLLEQFLDRRVAIRIRIQGRKMRTLPREHHALVTQFTGLFEKRRKIERLLPPIPGVTHRKQTELHRNTLTHELPNGESVNRQSNQGESAPKAHQPEASAREQNIPSLA